MATQGLNAAIPIHQDLENDLRRDIQSRKLAAGTAILPETELARRYGISRNTARKAIDSLTRAGLLRRVQGSGTFVTEAGGDKFQTKSRQVVLLSFATTISEETFHEEGTYLPMVNGVAAALQPRGYNLLVANVGADFAPPPCLLRGDVDGVIVNGEPPRGFWEKFIAPFPHVGVQYGAPDAPYTCVKPDNSRWSYLAVEYLKSLGHRNIGFVTACFDMRSSKEHYYAYLMAMDLLGLKVNPDWLIVWQRPKIDGVIPMERELPDLTARVEKALAATEKPSAFICLDWLYGKAVIEALRKKGLDIPGDASVLCRTNDAAINRKTGITGYSIRLSTICRMAAEILLGMIEGKSLEPSTVLVSPELVVCSSTLENRPRN